MLAEFTGQTFKRSGVYNLVKKLQKKFLVIDSVTGQEMIEFGGVQVHYCFSFCYRYCYHCCYCYCYCYCAGACAGVGTEPSLEGSNSTVKTWKTDPHQHFHFLDK